MNCGECNADNESGARFCAQCGTSLEKACEACRAPLAESARFCSACGERVATRYALPRAAAGAQSSGERRPLTVVFCDLVGATALGRQLDPEDLRDVLRAYQHTCHEEIRRLDGHVAQYLGDGVLAYFGYPRSEEDDAERAVRAALEIQRSLERIRAEESANPNAVPVEARIGIHSGPVLMSDVGEDAAAQTLALGNAANVAARLQSMAEAGGVLVSEDTQRLLRGRFRTRSLGHPELKGLGNEVGVHEVVGLADAAAPAPSSHSPLAGRDAELEHFRTCFGEAAARSGGVMSISGEAGVGKSRLLLAFREELAETPHAWVELHCARHTRRTPFQPLIDATERLLGFDAEDDGEEKLRKLERGLATLPGIELADSVPELASLLALPPSERFPASNASAEVQRARTLDALCALTLSLAERRPLVLTCEDLHWCDPSTLDFVTALVEATPGSPLLVLTTARSEFESPWRDAPGTRHLELARLDDQDTRSVIEQVVGERVLPEELLREIVARADGVPLFAEELAKSVLVSHASADNGSGAPSIDAPVPTTLQASLMARLDRLSAAKGIAQLGATIGREFSYELIESVSEFGVDELRRGLAQLVEAEVLHQRGDLPDAHFVFKHALLQDTAYESQLRKTRRELHGRIARVLEERHPARAAAEPHVVARHASLGQQRDRAIAHYQLAGQLALSRLANTEASDFFAAALRELEGLPADETRDQREAELRLARLGPLAEHGYEHEAVRDEIARLEVLAEAIPAGPARIPVLLGLAGFLQGGGDLRAASRFGRQLLEIARPLQIGLLEAVARAILGSLETCMGSVGKALEHFERAYDVTDGGETPAPAGPLDLDFGATIQCAYAVPLVLAGRAVTARECIARAVARTAGLEHAFGRSSVVNGGLGGFFLDDPQLAESIARSALDEIEGLGFHQAEALALVLRGWAGSCHGDGDAAVDTQRGLDLYVSSGARGGIAQSHLIGAETFSRLGRPDEALRYVDEGERWIERTGERAGFYYQVPMYRAEILLDHGSPKLEHAHALLVEAIEEQRPYDSVWMHLRICISLGRLGCLGIEPETARTRLHDALAAIPDAEAESRVRLARQLLHELETG